MAWRAGWQRANLRDRPKARRGRRPRWWPGRGREGRPPGDARLVVFLALVLVLVAISFLLFPSNYDFRWGVLVWVLVAVGLLVFLSLYRTGIKVPPLEAPPKEEFAFKGELDRLAQILRRADRGMRYSQVAVALRVRAAFLTRLRAERGLSERELASLLASPEAMDGVVGDPLIQAFLEDTALQEEALVRQHAPRSAPAFRFAQGDGFNQGLSQVVDAMEAWQ